MDTQELNRHIEREIRTLQREFAGTIPEDHVAQLCRKQSQRLRESASFNDFIPLLAHRGTREILVEEKRRGEVARPRASRIPERRRRAHPEPRRSVRR